MKTLKTINLSLSLLKRARVAAYRDRLAALWACNNGFTNLTTAQQLEVNENYELAQTIYTATKAACVAASARVKVSAARR